MAVEASPAETVIEDLTRLHEYGPVGITTRVPDLLAFKYHEPFATDDDRRKYVNIHSGNLMIKGEGANMVVQIEDVDGDVVRTLEPDEIEHVWVDHPHGHQMPVDGQSAMAPAIELFSGVPVLRWVHRAIEYDSHVRIEATRDPDFKGIGMYDAYDISGTDSQMTLEEAKETGRLHGRFLVSRVDKRQAVITSRTWYDETRPVIVRPPRHPEGVPLMHVEMIDHARSTDDEQLVANHRDHVRDLDYSMTLRYPADQMALDAIYLYATND